VLRVCGARANARARDNAERNQYDKTIAESESAYNKIVDSSSTLLNVLKKERETLSRKRLTHA